MLVHAFGCYWCRWNTLEIIFDAARSNTLWKHDCSSLNSPADEQLSGLLSQFFREADHSWVIYSSWKIIDVISQRTVGCRNDVLNSVRGGIGNFVWVTWLTLSFIHCSSFGCCRYACASIWFTAGGIVALIECQKFLCSVFLENADLRFQKWFYLRLSEIAHTNTSCLSLLHQSLHCFPRVDNWYVDDRNLFRSWIYRKSLWRLGKSYRPMDLKS